jgi:hypothetical protein
MDGSHPIFSGQALRVVNDLKDEAVVLLNALSAAWILNRRQRRRIGGQPPNLPIQMIGSAESLLTLSSTAAGTWSLP